MTPAILSRQARQTDQRKGTNQNDYPEASQDREEYKVGDFEARVKGAGYASLTLGYGRTEKEALQRLANNLSYYGIGHAL